MGWGSGIAEDVDRQPLAHLRCDGRAAFQHSAGRQNKLKTTANVANPGANEAGSDVRMERYAAKEQFIRRTGLKLEEQHHRHD